MPFSCEFKQTLLQMAFWGPVSGEEVDAALLQVERIEAEAVRSPDRLVDISGVEDVRVDYGFVERIAARRRNAVHKNPVRAAIVAPRPLQYGFARMFQTLNENERMDIQIFEQVADAQRWLAADSPPRSVI